MYENGSSEQRKVSSSLRHDNLVTTFDLDEDHHQYYMAMEFVDGTDLAAYVATHGPLPIDQAINVIRQVAAALECAWKHGIVHRDIKPNNILLTRENKAMLLDLGLAKIHEHSSDTSSLRVLTSTHYQLGTPEYMSPEQFDSSHHVDIRSDIYSLGCTFYAILTRRHPFEARDRSQLERLHRDTRTPIAPRFAKRRWS